MLSDTEMCISRVPVTPQCSAPPSPPDTEYSLQTHVCLPQPGPSLGPVCQHSALLRPIFTSFRLKLTPSLSKWRKMSVSRQRSVCPPPDEGADEIPMTQASNICVCLVRFHWSVSPPQRHRPLCVPTRCPRLVVTRLMIIQHRGPNDESVWVW